MNWTLAMLVAGACALLRWRPTRLFAPFGVLAGSAVLVAGFVFGFVFLRP